MKVQFRVKGPREPGRAWLILRSETAGARVPAFARAMEACRRGITTGIFESERKREKCYNGSGKAWPLTFTRQGLKLSSMAFCDFHLSRKTRAPPHALGGLLLSRNLIKSPRVWTSEARAEGTRRAARRPAAGGGGKNAVQKDTVSGNY
jgi:hypothetical protein